MRTIPGSVMLLAAPALACPDCPAARVTRAAVFDERFGAFLAMTMAPLVVIAVVCALLYRLGAAPR